MALLSVRSIKNVALLTEDGAFALFFLPHPGGFATSRVPTSGNLPSKAKKMLIPGGQPGGRWGGQNVCVRWPRESSCFPKKEPSLEKLHNT